MHEEQMEFATTYFIQFGCWLYTGGGGDYVA